MRKGDAMTIDELPPLVARAHALAATGSRWSTATPGRPSLRATDAKRQLFSADPRLVSAEVVLPDLQNSLLVGTRIG